MAEWGPALFFWILAIGMVGSAVLVVSFRNILHAALALVFCFVMVAGIYITLRADFLALIQILVYVGAIAVLMLFGIMLTRNAAQGNPGNRLTPVAAVLSALILFAVVWVVAGIAQFATITPGQELLGLEPIAMAMFGNWLLPFQIAGILLLAATIGAIVISKEN